MTTNLSPPDRDGVLEHDGALVVPVTDRRTGRTTGVLVLRDGRTSWHPGLDVTRVAMAAELVAGAVVIAFRLARRPSGPRAHVTMGPGGWVSMKDGGSMSVRPARRPLGRSRPVAATTPDPRAPLWARMLSAVPLGSLTRRAR
jgi:hypothetical protein